MLHLKSMLVLGEASILKICVLPKKSHNLIKSHACRKQATVYEDSFALKPEDEVQVASPRDVMGDWTVNLGTNASDRLGQGE